MVPLKIADPRQRACRESRSHQFYGVAERAGLGCPPLSPRNALSFCASCLPPSPFPSFRPPSLKDTKKVCRLSRLVRGPLPSFRQSRSRPCLVFHLATYIAALLARQSYHVWQLHGYLSYFTAHFTPHMYVQVPLSNRPTCLTRLSASGVIHTKSIQSIVRYINPTPQAQRRSVTHENQLSPSSDPLVFGPVAPSWSPPQIPLALTPQPPPHSSRQHCRSGVH